MSSESVPPSEGKSQSGSSKPRELPATMDSTPSAQDIRMAATIAPSAGNTDGGGTTGATHLVCPGQFGKYKLLKVLGQGGMGAVYMAEDPDLERTVALKIPLVEPGQRSAVLDRFKREAKSVAPLQHPSICPVFEVGEITGRPYMTMAFVEGKPLSDFIDPKKPLPVRAALTMTAKLCAALDYAHKKGVVHRDLKPANIMVNERREPVVMDFGLAKRASKPEETKLTQAGSVMGTPAYMAPEQAKGLADEMGPPCDIYSLGVILYEMLAGRVPFEGDIFAVLTKIAVDDPPPLTSLRANLDPAVNDLCLKALAKKASDRYASMADFGRAISDYLRTQAPASAASAERPAPIPRSTPAAESLTPDFLRDIAALPPAKSSVEQRTLASAVRGSSTTGPTDRGSSRFPTTIVAGAVAAVLVIGAAVVFLRPHSNDSPTADKPQLASVAAAKEPAPADTSKPKEEPTTAAATAEPLTFNGHRYQLVEAPGNWMEAKSKAEAMEGYLATVNSREELEWIRETFWRRRPPNAGPFYLGGYQPADGAPWEWVTGEPFDIKLWIGNPDGSGRYLWWRHENRWDDVGTNKSNDSSLLVEWGSPDDTQKVSPVAVPPAEALTFNGHRYLMVESLGNWNDAKTKAEAMGGHLATINSLEEREWLSQQYYVGRPKKSDANRAFLGGFQTSKGAPWEWITGEPFDSKLWVGRVPDGSGTNLTWENESSWDDVRPNFQCKYFIVEWDGSTETPNLAPTGSPPVEALTFNGHRYLLMDSPGDWNAAKAKAEAMGGYLAAITTPEEADWVRKEIFLPRPKTSNSDRMFIGGFRPAPTSPWEWTSGERFDMSQWQGAGPDDKRSGVVVLAWTSAMGWDDVSYVHNTRYFLVEWNDAVSAAGKAENGGAWNSPAFQQWMKDVAAMPAEKQIEAVSKKLQELNPGFDGRVTDSSGKGKPKIVDGIVRELNFETDRVANISPVRALTGLTRLHCSGTGGDMGRLKDLSPLEGMKLEILYCRNNLIDSLEPLRGIPLTELNVAYNRVADLKPLDGMKLKRLEIQYNRSIANLTPLRGMPLTDLSCWGLAVNDLTPLQGSPLQFLGINNTNVTDLSPLRGMELTSIIFTPEKITKGIDAIRDMPTLKSIAVGINPTDKFARDDFWKHYDAGAFRKPWTNSTETGLSP